MKVCMFYITSVIGPYVGNLKIDQLSVFWIYASEYIGVSFFIYYMEVFSTSRATKVQS